MFRLLLFVFIACLSLAQITCMDGKSYVKISMKCTSYCYEQGVKIYDGSTLLFQNDIYIDYQDSEVLSCIDTSSTGLYTLELTDSYGDGWYEGSYVTLTGLHGNIFFKNWMTERGTYGSAISQTYTLSLCY